MVKQKKCPLISVILSTYNWRDKWLKRAIDSIYIQTFKDFELILINDCSTNKIENVIKEYIKKYSNIIYVKNDKNLWLTKCLNIWIEKSNWKYIARIDDDDYWISKDKLEKQVDFMEKHQDYWLCWVWKIVRVDENDKILFTEYKNRLSDDEIRNHILQQNQFVHSGVLIRKSILNQIWYYDPIFKTAQDYELWARIGTTCKFINLEDLAVAYRLHTSAISIKKFREQKNNSFKIFWKYHRWYPNFLKAFILRIWAYLLPEKLRQFIWQKINPNLAVKEVNINSIKKNILVLNYEFPPLGWWASTVSYDISKWYVEAWYNVDVITMWFKGLLKYENKDGINIYRLKGLRRKKEICYPYEQLIYLFLWYFKAKQLLKDRKYDICHCHFLVPTWILALLLKKRFWLRYIVTAHGSDGPWHNPDRFTFLHKFTPWLLRRIIKHAESVIAPSIYLSNLIVKNIKWINKSIQVIPNWIDTNKFVPLKKEKIIASTGRLRPLKWIHLLAEAFSKISDTRGFELHICWDGPLMQQIKMIQSKSNNKIVLHWWMDNTSIEYVELLWRSAIYCLPSVSESWSLTLLEGMSSECAILTTNMWVCSEMAKDVWFYVDPNVKRLKKQLDYLIKNNKICEESWKKSRIKAINNYDKKDILRKYTNICESYL